MYFSYSRRCSTEVFPIGLFTGKFRAALFVFIIISIVVISALAYFNYRVRSFLPVTIEGLERTAAGAVKLDKVHYSGTKDGRIEWELDADTAIYDQPGDLVTLDTVLLKYYSSVGITYTLRSKAASYDGAKELINASGDVSLVSSDGYTLKTQDLSFFNSTGRITSDLLVEIESPGMKVRGTGLVMDIESGRFKMLKGVRTLLTDAAF